MNRADPQTQLSPAERLLMAGAKLVVSADDVETILHVLDDDRFQWQTAVRLAGRHGALGLLAHGMESSTRLQAAVPRSIRRELAVARLAIRLRHGLYVQHLAPVLAEVAAAGQPVTLMKGAVLATRLYPPGVRPLNDVDLLSPRRDLPRLASALQRHGFAAQRPLAAGRTGSDAHQMLFVRDAPAHALSVDLHWRIYPRQRRFFTATETLIARSRTTTFGSAQVSTMSPEDTLVHYATQLINDGLRTGWLRLADIHALVCGGVRWDVACEVARSMNASGALYLALRAAEMLGATVCPSALRRLEFECPGCEAATQLVGEPRWPFRQWVLSDAARYAVYALVEPCVRSRIRRLVHVPRLFYRQARRSGRDVAPALRHATRSTALTIGAAASIAASYGFHGVGAYQAGRWTRQRLWKRPV